MPWARSPGRAFLHRSADGGRSWIETLALDTAPYTGGYGLRGGVVLGDDTILLPLCDCPAYRRVFALRSTDGGRSWSRPIPIACDPARRFEEPAPLLLEDGRVLLLLRENASRTLWRVESVDGGLSWSPPEPTGIDGYPAHLCRLADGRLLCSYGFRRPPFAIRAAISEDEGRSWRSDAPLEIASGLGSKDMGYPCTLPRADGTLLTVFYARDNEGVTFVRGRIWRLF
ncbi:MAG: glycoside hydrolase [Geminicoccaceae bacterium]|nr:glycoside hydrolase [Geminicoccaceae bacterium]